MSARRYKTLTQIYSEMHQDKTVVFSVPAIGGIQPTNTGTYDEQEDMIKNQLQSIAKKASDLLSSIDTDNIEPWVVSKITLADDYIDSVYDRLMHNDTTNNDIANTDTSIYTSIGHEHPSSCGYNS